MRHEAPQFPLAIESDRTPAPFVLEPEPRRAPQAPAGQPELLTLPPRKPSASLAEWLAGLSPDQRRKACARRIGPGRGIDPVTGCPFTP